MRYCALGTGVPVVVQHPWSGTFPAGSFRHWGESGRRKFASRHTRGSFTTRTGGPLKKTDINRVRWRSCGEADPAIDDGKVLSGIYHDSYAKSCFRRRCHRIRPDGRFASRLRYGREAYSEECFERTKYRGACAHARKRRCDIFPIVEGRTGDWIPPFQEGRSQARPPR